MGNQADLREEILTLRRELPQWHYCHTMWNPVNCMNLNYYNDPFIVVEKALVPPLKSKVNDFFVCWIFFFWSGRTGVDDSNILINQISKLNSPYDL